MAFTKTQKVESTEVLSPENHQVVQDQLRVASKQSVGDLTDSEKQQLTAELDK